MGVDPLRYSDCHDTDSILQPFSRIAWSWPRALLSYFFDLKSGESGHGGRYIQYIVCKLKEGGLVDMQN